MESTSNESYAHALSQFEVIGCKSALEIKLRLNRLVREDQISSTNEPDKLLDHLRRRRPIHVSELGVYLGNADAVVPRTRVDLGCYFHAHAHPFEHRALDYTCPARVMEVRNESQSILSHLRTSPQPFRHGYYLLHWPIS